MSQQPPNMGQPQPTQPPIAPRSMPPVPPAPYGYGMKPQHIQDAHSKKILAGLMALFLGNLGIHKFVLGYTGAGVTMLLINCTIVGAFVIRIISIIEGIMYLTKTDEDFYQMYIANHKEWF